MAARFLIPICVALALLPLACNDSSSGTPVVTVTGQPLVVVGTTAQYSATTTNATDTSYMWATNDPLIATIDTTGMLTSHAEGTVIVTAIGSPSGRTGTLTIACSETPNTEVPNYDKWVASPHNDKTAEAFNHWNADGEVPTTCARCHSTPGFRDYLGADGTPPGTVENPAPIGTTVECIACHNDAADALHEVTFPSGVTVDGLGLEATCMTCHQGRASTETVDDAIAKANPPDDDTVITTGFINVHYYPAAATRYGMIAQVGYLYSGEEYDVYFRHVPGLERCQDCHDPHTQQVKVNVCAGCHNVTTKEDLKNIRMMSSLTRDYDGDGDKVEGIWWEIDGLRVKLLKAIRDYAREVAGMPITYDEHRYPYWYADANDNDTPDPGEGSYKNFTARLLKATYNYQYSVKDPGGFAHNAKFMIQLLHDSITDLNTQIMTPVDMSAADRNDYGHFDATEEAFRHWDGDGEVSASCARCHGVSLGFSEYLTYKANTPQPIPNGFDCATCHTTFDTFETRRITQVEFPSGLMTPAIPASVPTDDPLVMSNICITCHQGRVSKKDIDEAIADDPENLRFQNVHYLAAAATLFGTEAQVAYEYDGKTYVGKFPHVSVNPTNTNNCVFCHDPIKTKHTFQPDDNIDTCRACHRAQDNTTLMDVHDIRLAHLLDYDGDGKYPGSPSGTETLQNELYTMADALLAAMNAYSLSHPVGSEGQMRTTVGIEYDGDSYPYFFIAGLPHTRANGFNQWDGKLLRASQNYQLSQKEHGSWAHNFPYVIECVYDSIEDLGGSLNGSVSPYIRP